MIYGINQTLYAVREKNEIVRNMIINIFPHNFKYYVSHFENKITKKIMKIWRDVWNKKLSLISSSLSQLLMIFHGMGAKCRCSLIYLIWLYSTKLRRSVWCQMFVWEYKTCMYLFSIHIQTCHWNAIISKQLHGTQIFSK